MLISSDLSLALPERATLAEQAAQTLRKALRDGQWRSFLPGERRLCAALRVSRPTIRTAVQQLAQEGLVATHHGRRHRILAPARKRPRQPGGLVLLVSHQPVADTSFTAYQGITEMRAQLAAHGFATETVICPATPGRAHRQRLEAFLSQNAVACCVLLSLNRGLQAWFAAKRIPTLVLGSSHTGIALPSLDVDYRSVCRHAAGLLRAKGHRRLAFLVPHSDAAGDLASEEGFREGVARGPAEGRVVRHNGTNAGLAATLRALLTGPRPPTALLVAKPNHVFFVVAWLLREGRRVPGDLSLIARDHDPLFANLVDHYRFNRDAFALRLGRLVRSMAGQRFLPLTPHLILPRYQAGATIGPPA